MKKHYNLRRGIFFLLSLMAFSYSADAANRTWDGGGDDLTWSDPLNWSSDLVPTAADLAIFTSSETVTITATTTIKILDIRPGITVTLNIGTNTLNVGASGTSNIIRIDASTLLINSGTLNANTADNTRDAVQFRGTGGSFNVGAGATANVTGRDAFVSKTDAVNGAINNSGVLNISVLTGDDGILLKSGHPLTLVNNACAVINLGTCRIKTNISDGASITNNGLITYNPSDNTTASGAILLRTGNTATNNGFYHYVNNSTNFATGNAGTGTLVDNGVDLYPTVVIDALGTCMIDLSSTGSGMEAYNWIYGGTTFATNGGDGTLDVTAAGFPNTAGPHTITADCFPAGVTVSIDVTNTCPIPTVSLVDSDGDGIPDIADPCSCSDPLNILDGAGQPLWFHDFIEITSSPGETWEICTVNAGGLSDASTAPYPVGTVIPEIAPGVYYLDVWHLSGVGFDIDFCRTSGAPFTLNESNMCDAVNCSSGGASVPTLSEWGIIIMTLLLLCFGTLVIGRRELAFAENGGNMGMDWNLPFEAKAFTQIVNGIVVIALIGFGLSFWVFGAITMVDIVGTAIAAPILAYLIYLFKVIK